MIIRFAVASVFLSLFGCANHPIYIDLTARTSVPNGVGAGLVTTTHERIMTWGAFGTSSIWVAYRSPLPDTVVASWREGGETSHHKQVFLRPLLPPIDPRKQKYHLQFWFHPGDSLDVKVDVLDIGDCEHTRGIGKTRTPHHGPCGVMNDW
ncbi:MAG: hypothetical protein RL173_801 [Fibrobacterota bacterium]|jgi:hypothetical protein